jgi:hypothetical protein
MGFQNSHIRNVVLGVYRETLLDLYDTLQPLIRDRSHPELSREAAQDYSYLQRRCEREGFRILTTSLPAMGKAIDSILAGKETSTKDFGLGKWFLRVPLSYLREIASSEDVTTAQAQFIRILRTFFVLCYKLEVPSTQEQIDRKINEFIECEEELRDYSLPVDNRHIEGARRVLDKIVGDFEIPQVLAPRHGPGAVATGEKGDEKWVFTHLYSSLHQVFPYYDYVYGIRSSGRAIHLASRISRYKSMKRLPYPVAKLCLVPKDSRGPRIISCEPLEVQYMQQSIAPLLMAHLESKTRFATTEYGDGRPVSRINFIDQSVNAKLALFSSRERDFATLDLSEASDRVSLALVEAIWPENHLAAFRALRSHATLLPNGSELELRKFAPMGSALCFPVESAIFYALCVSAVQEFEQCTYDLACTRVFVYGDDIIVPVSTYPLVRKVLESVGLKVNQDKSFASGSFRESCGCDAWLGHDVTPIKLRKLPGTGPSSGSNFVAWLAYASNMIAAGMPRSAKYCKKVVEDVLGSIPTTPCPVGYLSVVDPSGWTPLSEYSNVKWSFELSNFTARVWTLKTKSLDTELNCFERLHRNLLGNYADLDPEKVVVRNATQISRRRKVIPYIW